MSNATANYLDASSPGRGILGALGQEFAKSLQFSFATMHQVQSEFR
jgi:hypothetical protein